MTHSNSLDSLEG